MKSTKTKEKQEIKKELYFDMLSLLISSKYDILTDKEVAKQASKTLHHFITTRINKTIRINKTMKKYKKWEIVKEMDKETYEALKRIIKEVKEKRKASCSMKHCIVNDMIGGDDIDLIEKWIDEEIE